MEYYIAIFKSRAEALSYVNNLKRNFIYASLIPTPKEVGRTCGLSVKIEANDIDNAKYILSISRSSSFAGWYRCYENDGKTIVVRG